MLWSVAFLILLRGLWLIVRGWPKSSRLMVVLGSGGHTAEMCSLLKKLRLDEFSRIDFVLASNDSTSIPKLHTELTLPAKAEFHHIFRCRNVGQSYFTSIFSTLYSFLPALWLLLKTKPAMIVSNGPGTSIPILYCAFALRLLLISRPKLLYLESFCRVTTLSWSGKLTYPISDFFYVQWPQLHSAYPSARYVGLLS